MHIIILSGGSGKRLWPLSSGKRTKVFLKLLHAPDGSKESMIQRVIRQLEGASLLESVLVVSHHTQTEITRNQIGDRLPIISERHRRGTFPAVALAVTYLHTYLHVDKEDVVCFLPADLFVESSFFELVKQMPDILERSGAELALIGSAPTHPSSQFGYIVPKLGAEPDYHRIERFIEKPEERLAKRLIAKKAMWNCGVYAFKLGFLLNKLTEANLPVSFDSLIQQIPQSPELSFDREIAERSRNSVMLPYHGTWLDLGSWDTLASRLNNQAIGLGTVSGNSPNTQLINELDIPIHVINGRNLMVVAGLDGILVANKQHSHLIKDVLSELETPNRIKYEEKRWGTRKLLDCTTDDKTEIRTTKVRIAAGMHTSYHYHSETRETMLVLEGSGEVLKDGSLTTITAGERIEFLPGSKHGISATTSLTYLEVQTGPCSATNDHVQLLTDW